MRYEDSSENMMRNENPVRLMFGCPGMLLPITLLAVSPRHQRKCLICRRAIARETLSVPVRALLSSVCGDSLSAHLFGIPCVLTSTVSVVGHPRSFPSKLGSVGVLQPACFCLINVNSVAQDEHPVDIAAGAGKDVTNASRRESCARRAHIASCGLCVFLPWSLRETDYVDPVCLS